MMNRLEIVRKSVDDILQKTEDTQEKRCGYLHLYGVSQACVLIALKRKENAELAAIAGMLHDIYSYRFQYTKNHAELSAAMAKNMLDSLKIFTNAEIDVVCGAIYNHSDKANRHSSFDEVLIDADVMQHCLYNPQFEIAKHEKERFKNLSEEFGF